MVYLESVSCFTPTAHLPEVLHFSESHSPASDRARLVVMTEDRPPVTVQPAVVALNVQVPEPRVGTRSYYSTHFLATAQDAARLARSTELKLLQADERRFSLQHRGQVLSSVIHSAAFLEATVGEVLQDARDGHLTEKLADVGGRTICAWAGLWEALDSGGIGNALRYYKAALLAAGKPIFDTGAQPWQDAKLLVDLRNYLLHYKPSSAYADEPERLVGKLQRSVDPNPLSTNASSVDGCLSAGCAEWALDSAVALVSAFADTTGAKPNYQLALDDLRANNP